MSCRYQKRAGCVTNMRNAQINAVGQKDNDGDHEDEDDVSSILNDRVVSNGKCLLDEEWQNAVRLDYNSNKLATADGTVLGACNIDLNHN